MNESVADLPENPRIRSLDGARLDAMRDFSWATHREVQSNRSLRAEWLTRLLQDGIAFLSDVPSNEGAIFEAASLAGRVLETNYGMAFDVRSVPGFQVLHALVTSPAGGESLFGDGFAIAEHLRAIAPEDFALLTGTAVPFLYRSQDAELYAERPLIQLSCSGEVTAVHYNSRSIAPLRLAPHDVGSFFGAYRRFAAVLRDPRFHLQLRLRDGDLVIFDNRRTLHGRLPFSSARHPRHLRGCYLSRDSVYSEAAVLRRELHLAASS